MKFFSTFIAVLFLLSGILFADQYSEMATDGTLDQEWDFNTTTHTAGDTLVVVDSTASTWGSHVLAYTDAGYTGLTHMKDIMLTNYTVEADIYIIGPADAAAPLYAGVGIRMAHDETKFYRLVYRNSSSSDNGQIKLQGYDGASWHISKSWDPGVDFDALETGWHNFKIKVNGANFWAYIDGKQLPGGVQVDSDPFLNEGYAGIYKYNSSSSTILFDNFVVTTQDLFISEYAEGSSNNKYVEIFNGTGADVDLSAYSIQGTNNGTSWGDSGERDVTLSGTLADGDVFVMAADAADQAILDYADMAMAYESPVHHNGDDGIALLKNGMIIDAVGVENYDPGSGWEVAGVENATANHTLVRKEEIFMGETDWDASAGTDSSDSEWLVMDSDTWTYLGAHPGMPVVTPEYVNVTIRANMATNLDTLSATHYAQIRGTLNNNGDATFPDGSKITWGSDSDLLLTSAGGDCWEITFQMAPEDTLYYKFWTGIDASTPTSPGDGWEGAFESSNGLGWDTRTFISGMADTTLAVQYYHASSEGTVDQYWRPYEEKQDTVAIYFRVNMAGATESKLFDPDVNGPVGIRGSKPVGDDGWSEGAFVPLTREANSVLDGSFWSGAAYVPVDSITVGNTQQYKFFVQNAGGIDWESTANRELTFTQDMVDAGAVTVEWDWFSGIKYVGIEPVQSILTWRVSTEAIQTFGLFDRGVGDSIFVRGPRGWGKDEAIRLYYQPLLKEWVSAGEEFETVPGNEISYKYYLAWDSSRVDETSPNYIEFIDLEDDGYEEPSVRGGSNRLHVYGSEAEQTMEGDFGFDRQFFNSVPANGVFEHSMNITWNVDMTNATSNDPAFTAGDSVMVQWDGELMGVIQGFNNTGEEGRFLLLTDSDNDMVYTGTFEAKDMGWYQLGYVLAYKASDGTWVQNGSGTEYGRRYYQYIHPNSIAEGSPWPIPDWPTEFSLPTMDWVAEDLYVESPPPDLTTATAIDDKEELPFTYALEQNYPNPFNPSTTIEFSLAERSDVTISIYNVMGQLVNTLVSTEMNAGSHQLVWNGKNRQGNQVTSGIYFLQMKSKNFTKVRKMTLLK